jgi:Ras-related protein Rab-8A
MSSGYYNLKIMLIGDAGVGKSSLLLRYTDDKFNPSMLSTIGLDFKIKELYINSDKLKVQIWDTAGQERYRTITTAYYRQTNGVIFVFDVTNINSFHNIKNWITNVSSNINIAPIDKILVGAKYDNYDNYDNNNISVTKDDAIQLAKMYDMEYIETSAKTNYNVDSMFYKLIEKIMNNFHNNNFHNNNNNNNYINMIKKDDLPNSNKSCC